MKRISGASRGARLCQDSPGAAASKRESSSIRHPDVVARRLPHLRAFAFLLLSPAFICLLYVTLRTAPLNSNGNKLQKAANFFAFRLFSLFFSMPPQLACFPFSLFLLVCFWQDLHHQESSKPNSVLKLLSGLSVFNLFSGLTDYICFIWHFFFV